MTFAKGASLEDPSGLFNSSLEGNIAARHRFPRGRQDRREGAEGAHPRGRGAERVGARCPEETKERLRRRQRYLAHSPVMPRRSDKLAALLIVELDPAPEIFRRTADGDHALLVQPATHRIRCKDLVHFLVHGSDHRPGRVPREHEADIADDLELRKSFADRRHIGQQRESLFDVTPSLDLARRATPPSGSEQQRYLPAQEIVHRGRRSLVGNVGHGETAVLLQHLAGEAVRRRTTRAAETQILVFCCPRPELGDRIRRHILAAASSSGAHATLTTGSIAFERSK